MSTQQGPHFTLDKAPTLTTPEAKELYAWLQRQLTAMQRTLYALPVLDLQVSYSAPLRPRAGMIVYADGTEWDPGSGEGPYYFNLAGSWVAL